MSLPAFHNKFLEMYRLYTADTESPELFHVWSALTGISATLGRRCYLPFGVRPIYPNLFVILVGPPATRKGTAMDTMMNLVRTCTNVRFGPDDTGGNRQGLIAAYQSGEGLDKDTEDEINSALNASSEAMLERLANVELEITPRHKADMFNLCIAAEEFTSLTGAGNGEILTFLQRCYDGKRYDYQTKHDLYVLHDPLMTLIGCTTPTYIASCIPAEAVGQGFMSRIILVYAPHKKKMIPWPDPLAEIYETQVKSRLSEIQYKFEGPFEFAAEAREFMTKAYQDGATIKDHRFLYYMERRHTHMLKVAMAMAAADGRMHVSLHDVQDAEALLEYTEQFMPEALGEFGMSPLAKAKQRMMEFLTSTNEPVTTQVLWGVMHRDMTQRDFPLALADMVQSGKIAMIQTNAGQAYMARGTTATERKVLDTLMEAK